MRQVFFKKRGRAGLMPSASVTSMIRRGMRTVKALPRTLARTLQQPSTQYHIALLFAAILTFLLSWTMFLSTLPHIPIVTFIERF